MTVAIALLTACAPQGTGGPSGTPGSEPPAQTSAVAPSSSAVASIERSPPAATPSATPSEARWSRVDPVPRVPAAREDHTWTVDEATRYAYLFGGRNGARVFDDLWRFDLTADRWSRVNPVGASPEGRFGHTGTWVPGRGLVVWSGQRGAAFFNDLWLYQPSANRWSRLPAAGAVPDARYGSCASLGPDGRLWISHGFTEDSGRFSDTRAYDFAAARWTEQRPSGDTPAIRCLHDCVWAPNGRFVLYAGQTSGVRAIGDLWSLDVDRGQQGTWQQGATPPLAARNLYAIGVVGQLAYVFGGTPREGAKLADTWRLDLTTLTWTHVRASGPSGRSGAAFVPDPIRGRLLLFGGETDGGVVSEVWELRTSG